jgi:hypothetical protein
VKNITSLVHRKKIYAESVDAGVEIAGKKSIKNDRMLRSTKTFENRRR